MSTEADLVIANLIHQLVSASREYRDNIDGLLAQDKSRYDFSVDRKTLAHIRGLLELNAEILSTMLEENQFIMDRIAKLSEKYPPKEARETPKEAV